MVNNSLRFYPQRRGASAIVVVNLFVVMMLFAFFAINISNMQRHHTASQISSDLAARWGVDMLSRETNLRRVERQVRDLAHRNWTVSDNISRNWLNKNRQNIDVEIEFGTAQINGSEVTFKKNKKPYNSLRVNSKSYVNVKGFAPMPRNEVKIDRAATAIALERDICLVIDRSGSMTFDLQTGGWMYDYGTHSYNKMSTSSNRTHRRNSYQWWWYRAHPTNSRWSTMIPAMYGLADELNKTRQNEKFSIVSYSTDYSYNFYDFNLNWRNYSGSKSSEEVDPTFNYQNAVATFDNRYKYDKLVAGGTNISAGIDEAVGVLTGSSARPNAYKTMIVMTDGQYNNGRAPWLAAADAAEAGIEVYTVTFSNQADQSSMRRTAADGNGQHFHAPNGDDLEEVFRKIANIPPAAFIE